MNIYWAIAKSSKYPTSTYVERIEAANDDEAIKKAEEWHREDIGPVYTLVVAKEIFNK